MLLLADVGYFSWRRRWLWTPSLSRAHKKSAGRRRPRAAEPPIAVRA